MAVRGEYPTASRRRDGALFLVRKPGEEIMIGDKVRLAIEVPRDRLVRRGELQRSTKAWAAKPQT
jgi:sRNA-binding carbon storage regulator CsrA